MVLVSDRIDQVRDLSALGYWTFPCGGPDGKKPLTARGFKDAAVDERAVLHLWAPPRTHANIGIACGASGIAVLDIDAKYGASPAEVFAQLGLDASALVVVWTGEAPERCAKYPDSLEGERGAHAWFRGPAATGPLEIAGCEIRGNGAYVMAPPSAHRESGVPYAWHRPGLPPPARDLPPLPASLARRQRSSSKLATAGVLRPSERHEGLVAIAARLVAHGVMEHDLLVGALLEADRARCQPPKNDRAEVEAIVAWALQSRIAESERSFAVRAREALVRSEALARGSWWTRSPEREDAHA